MRPAHLHLGGRYPPLGIVNVELRPFRFAQLARPDEYKRGKLQRVSRGRLTFEAVDGAQQRADGVGFNDCRPMGDRRRDKRAAEIGRRIALRSTRCDRIPERRRRRCCELASPSHVGRAFRSCANASRISGALISAIGRLPNSAIAKSSSHCFFFNVVGASFSASNFTISSSATALNVFRRDIWAARRSVLRSIDGSIPSDNSFFAASRLMRASASDDHRILAEREQLLLAVEAISQAPKLRGVRLNQQKEPAPSDSLKGFSRGLAERKACRFERAWVRFRLKSRYQQPRDIPTMIPTKWPDVSGKQRRGGGEEMPCSRL